MPENTNRDPHAANAAPVPAARTPRRTWRRRLRAFLLPQLNRRFFLRLGLVTLAAWLVFGHLFIPTWSRGDSMAPNYHSGGVNVCFTLRYAFHPPGPGDVVMVSFAGRHVMLLKRVVAVAGETVEFRYGRLYVNYQRRPEPWVKFPCDWNLPPRKVKPGHVYVVGDNRSMPLERHYFGQAPLERIVGGPLW
jgi:signal peptidase I